MSVTPLEDKKSKRLESTPHKRRGYALLIERAIAEEVKAGTSRDDIAILRPVDRNARLQGHMHRLRLVRRAKGCLIARSGNTSTGDNGWCTNSLLHTQGRQSKMGLFAR